MKKQMKRTVYEAPVTERFQVELEGAMMSASIYENSNHSDGVTSGEQEYQSFEDGIGFVQNGDNGIKWE